MNDKDLIVSLKDLPYKASVKYLGCTPAKGLWGMKHTRKPVDYLVGRAKANQKEILPLVKLEINLQGLSFQDITNKSKKSQATLFPIENISYGVQDLVYTRVFSMIIVTSDDENVKDELPFVCHSFVCDSRNQARKVTCALATAFQEFGRQNKDESGKKKKFAVDLRTPEEQAKDQEEEETEA